MDWIFNKFGSKMLTSIQVSSYMKTKYNLPLTKMRLY